MPAGSCRPAGCGRRRTPRRTGRGRCAGRGAARTVGTADRGRRDSSPLPPLPRRWALARARKARLTCSGAASRLNCLMGFNSVLWGSTRRQGHLVWFAGAAAVDSGCGAGNFRAAAGRLSPCRPDHEAPRCGCRRPVLACSSIPGDRDHRFRRSGPRTGHAARAAPPLFACGMPTRAALIVLAWAGDGSPIRGCTT